jgi:hypothetical protein
MYEQIDLTKVKTYKVAERKNKVDVELFGKPLNSESSLSEWVDNLPNFLAAKDLKSLAQSIIEARELHKPVIVLMGAHVIKTGCSPYLIKWMQQGIITHLAGNGACAVHDSEVARFGFTSEDVIEGLRDGSFGMAEETGNFLSSAAISAAYKNHGYGEQLSKELHLMELQHSKVSLLYQSRNYCIPFTIHVAFNTDINHSQPSMDSAAGAIGQATHNDFKILCNSVKELQNGGVVLNLGSAVNLPTNLEKSVAVCRNLGYPVQGFVGANFDFIQHYRAMNNLVHRVEALGGKGYSFTGHHEIMIPLLDLLLFHNS